MMQSKQLARFALFAFIVPMLVATASADDKEKEKPMKIRPGYPAPNFKATDGITGKEFELKQLRGNVVLIDFWAPWCGYCKKETPNLKAAWSKFKDEDFKIVGVSLHKDLQRAKDYVRANELAWIQVYDDTVEIRAKYRVSSVPALFLLDPDGQLITTDLRGDKLEPAIAKALKKAKTGDRSQGDAGDPEELAEREARAKHVNAELAAVRALITQGELADAVNKLRAVKRGYEDVPRVHEAESLLNELLVRDDVREALERDAGEREQRLGKQRAKGLLAKARLSKAAKRPEEARKLYKMIIDKYPETDFAKDARKELAEMDEADAEKTKDDKSNKDGD